MNDKPYDIKETIGFHIAATHFNMRKGLTESFRQSGFNVSPDQWSILAYLYKREPKSQRDIAQYLEKDNASITRTLDILQEKGLLERQNSPEDRRVFLICLTSEGEELAAGLIQHVKNVGGESPLTREEKEILKGLLNKLR